MSWASPGTLPQALRVHLICPQPTRGSPHSRHLEKPLWWHLRLCQGTDHPGQPSGANRVQLPPRCPGPPPQKVGSGTEELGSRHVRLFLVGALPPVVGKAHLSSTQEKSQTFRRGTVVNAASENRAGLPFIADITRHSAALCCLTHEPQGARARVAPFPECREILALRGQEHKARAVHAPMGTVVLSSAPWAGAPA